MSQKHDKGAQKRKREPEKPQRLSTNHLAASLVERGLASRSILDGYRPAPRKDYDE